ncbi:MAG: PIN domain-containing protein [Gemmatimonadales bacterium]|nr:PIN domain-containing protein [Gemmatimonadales bacterium]
MERALIDTGALLALVIAKDQYHRRAVETYAGFRARGGHFIGTPLVLSEFHNLVRARLPIASAGKLLGALLHDRIYGWQDLPADALQRAQAEWIDRYPDQGFSLADAVSFELMRSHRISKAFSFDRHFVTAGFSLLD